MPDTVIEQVNNMLTKDSPAHLVFTDCQGKLLSDHNIESSEPAEDYDIPGVAYQAPWWPEWGYCRWAYGSWSSTCGWDCMSESEKVFMAQQTQTDLHFEYDWNKDLCANPNPNPNLEKGVA